jgi:hypothetical protein
MPISKIVLVVLFLGLPLFIPLATSAFTIQAHDVVLIEDDVVDESIVAAGEKVTVDSTVKGDVVIAGGTVTVSGVIEGDLIVAGGNIVIDADIQGDLRAAGGTIEFSGKVGKNMTVFGGNVTVKEGASIAGDAVFGAGIVTFDGSVGRDVWGGAGSATVGANIGRDFSFNATGKDDGSVLQLTKTAAIGRDFIHNDRSNITKAKEVTIGGEDKTVAVAAGSARDLLARYASGAYFYGRIISLFSLWVLGLVALWVIRPVILRTAEAMNQRVGWHLLTGFVAIFAIPLAMLLLLLTIIGAPLTAIVGASVIILFFFSKVVLSLWVGMKLMNDPSLTAGQREQKLLGTFLLGAFLVILVGSLPVVGWILVGVGMLVAFGALLWIVKKMIARQSAPQVK